MEEDQILPLFTSPVISCPEHLDPSLKLRSLELQDYDKGLRIIKFLLLCLSSINI